MCITREQKYHNSGGTAELLEEREKLGLSVIDLYEILSTFSFVAGETSHVRLIPSCAVLPWRQPVLFAKQAVTLHELSGGRFVSSVVIGNIASDFRAMNVDFEQRGKIFDEYLEVLKLAFSQNQGSFKGRFIEFSNDNFMPRPSRKLPIWIGGSFSERVFTRIAKFGNGFLTSGGPEAFEDGIRRLGETMKTYNRRVSEVEVGSETFMCLMDDREKAESRASHTVESFFKGKEWGNQDLNRIKSAMNDAFVGTPDDLIERIDLFVKAGLTFFDMRLVNGSLGEVVSMMKTFAKDVMPSFNA